MWPRLTIHTKKAEAMITDTNTNSSNVLHLTDPKTQTFWSDNSNAIIKIETWGTNHTQQTIKSISHNRSSKTQKKIMTFKQKSNHYPKLKKQKQSRVDGKKTKKQLKWKIKKETLPFRETRERKEGKRRRSQDF